jgi:peptidoglycan/LPS O-acetylase OafA/YrhL
VTSRNQSLDVLRGVAVLLVVGFHGFIGPLARFGWIGVDLFFVLSGFLISNLLYAEYLKTGELVAGLFLLRRGLKIWPGFYCFLAFGFLLSFRYHPLRPYVLLGTFTSNYIREPLPSLFGAIWSLCVEEHFYLALPILFLVLKSFGRKGFAAVPIICALAMVFCTYLRVKAPYDPSVFTTHASHLRFDSLLAGVALGYFYNFRPRMWSALSSNYSLFALAFLIPAFLVDQSNHWMQSYGLSGLYIAFSALIAWAVTRTPKNMVGKFVAAKIAVIGFYSYSIYLWHSLFVITTPIIPQPTIRKIMYITLSLSVGVGLAKVIELPVLRLRERILPQSTAARVPAQVHRAAVAQSVTP